MFIITKRAENRVDITIDGPIDQDMMRDALWDLLAQSEGITDGLMYYRLTNFELPSFGALAVEMTFLPKLFGLYPTTANARWLRMHNGSAKQAKSKACLSPGSRSRALNPGKRPKQRPGSRPADRNKAKT